MSNESLFRDGQWAEREDPRPGVYQHYRGRRVFVRPFTADERRELATIDPGPPVRTDAYGVPLQ